jgi:hypothetical protein
MIDFTKYRVNAGQVGVKARFLNQDEPTFKLMVGSTGVIFIHAILDDVMSTEYVMVYFCNGYVLDVHEQFYHLGYIGL